MRVIAGRLRSRRLHAPQGAQTRPTHDRVKEALFSVLGNIAECRVLDLYAGTGALGIEALSRGAKHACFVERSRNALAALQRNLSELELLAQSSVLARSVESSAAELIRLAPFDLVFCDPPWKELDEVVSTLSELRAAKWLSADGMLLLEHPARSEPAGIGGLQPHAQRRWGDTAVTFYALAD